jgi:putative membrane protein insertion efficiency factor
MEEKKIPHYINSPEINRLTAPENKLYRPEIHFKKAFLIACATILLTFVSTFLVSYIAINLQNAMITACDFRDTVFSVYWKLQLLVFLLLLRYILIWFVRIYQHYAKSETRLRCCYIPSCSEYAILALKKYGALIGGIKSVRRLLRCGPPGGVDYP